MLSVRLDSIASAFYGADLVVSALLVLILGYFALLDCLKKRKQRRLAKEENEALGDGPRTESDCENGIADESKNNKNDSDHVVRSPGTGVTRDFTHRFPV